MNAFDVFPLAQRVWQYDENRLVLLGVNISMSISSTTHPFPFSYVTPCESLPTKAGWQLRLELYIVVCAVQLLLKDAGPACWPISNGMKAASRVVKLGSF